MVRAEMKNEKLIIIFLGANFFTRQLKQETENANANASLLYSMSANGPAIMKEKNSVSIVLRLSEMRT
jgi:hypothetical protein